MSTVTLTPEVLRAIDAGWRPWPGFQARGRSSYYGGRNEPDIRSSFTLGDGEVLDPVWLWDHSHHQSTTAPRSLDEYAPSTVPAYVRDHVEADSPAAWYLNRLASIK